MNTKAPLVLDLVKGNPALVLDLEKEAPDLVTLRGQLTWDAKASSTAGGYEFDIDIFVVSTALDGTIDDVKHVMYFKHKWNDNNSLGVPVDNKKGGAALPEHFLAKIKDLPADRGSHEIFAIIFEADKRKQNFGMISNAHFDVMDEATGNVLKRYNLTQDYSADTAVHIGSLKRMPDGRHEFHPQGVGGILDATSIINSYV